MSGERDNQPKTDVRGITLDLHRVRDPERSARTLSDLGREAEEAAKRDDLTVGAAKVDAMARELNVVLAALPIVWHEMSDPGDVLA
ncbi:MAG: hypothetical protein ACXWE5_13845 [Actinomycetota bacterium]